MSSSKEIIAVLVLRYNVGQVQAAVEHREASLRHPHGIKIASLALVSSPTASCQFMES